MIDIIIVFDIAIALSLTPLSQTIEEALHLHT